MAAALVPEVGRRVMLAAMNTGRKTALLLINLGTPESTSVRDVRAYLREFLSDRRVVEVPRSLWWFVLNGIILPFRPRRSAEAYAKIWNRERDESPLKTITRAQAEGLQGRLGDGVRVDWAMRYGRPSIAGRLVALMEEGFERIVVFPLYPQYSASTTGTVVDAVGEALMAMRHQPTVRFVPPYHDHPAHVRALAESLRAQMESLPWKPQKVIASYHGLPKSFVEKGDPYERHCRETSRLLAGELGLDEEVLLTTFQSRLGRAEWLKPYTAETIAQLAGAGVKNLLVVTPAFAADCLETLEEIGMGAAEIFREHGGENFAVAPCLNASAAGLDMLEAIAREELSGWA